MSRQRTILICTKIAAVFPSYFFAVIAVQYRATQGKVYFDFFLGTIILQQKK